jgi:hypothetical protein
MKTIKVNFKDLSKHTNTPIFAYCRKLIKEGEDPNTRLEVYRNHEDWDVAVPSIGEGAKWTVKEEPTLNFTKLRNSHLKI